MKKRVVPSHLSLFLAFTDSLEHKFVLPDRQNYTLPTISGVYKRITLSPGAQMFTPSPTFYDNPATFMTNLCWKNGLWICTRLKYRHLLRQTRVSVILINTCPFFRSCYIDFTSFSKRLFAKSGLAAVIFIFVKNLLLLYSFIHLICSYLTSVFKKHLMINITCPSMRQLAWFVRNSIKNQD